MSGSNRLIVSDNELSGESLENLKTDLINANAEAIDITESGLGNE